MSREPKRSASQADPILGNAPFRFAPTGGLPTRATRTRPAPLTRVLAGIVCLLAAALALVLALQPAQAQSGGNFAVARQVIANGGGAASGGDWQLQGTTGQAATNAASGGDYTLRSGYWHGAAGNGGGGDAIHADGFE